MRKNLKKRLAMVLAAAMVFSTPVAVNNTVAGAAETMTAPEDIIYNPGKEVDGSTAWNSAGGGPIDLVDGYRTVVEFTNEPFIKDQSNWSNFVFETSDFTSTAGIKGVTMRADSHFWTYGEGEKEPVVTKSKSWGDDDWEDWRKNTAPGNVKLTVEKTNETTVEFTVLFKDGNTENYTLVYPGAVPSDYKFYVGSDGGKIVQNKISYQKPMVVTGSSVTATAGESEIHYSFDAVGAPAGTGFEVSVSNGTETVTGSAVAADGGHVTYNYPEKGTLVSGTYTFKVTDVKAGENDKTNYFLNGDAADSVTVEVKDGVITGTKETVTVKLTDGKAALTADKKSIDYTFKAENAPAKGAFEYEVSKGDAVVATGSAAAVAEVKVNYAPTESGKYSFKVTRVTADESDKTVYALDGDAAAELDFTVSANPPATNPPATNPPATNPPATNPPATNPPAAGTVKKVTVKAANQKAGTKTVYLKKGGKVTLTATVTGTGKFSKAVKWSTSKKAVATVSSKGVVKAKKAGTAKITAASKTNKAKKATITIKVSKKAKKNKKLTLKVKKKNLKKGKTYTVAIKSMTKGTTDAVTYKTNKKKIATVDKFGVVKAKKKGSAVITVKCGKKKAKLTIKVK